jgi:hypothetical protein
MLAAIFSVIMVVAIIERQNREGTENALALFLSHRDVHCRTFFNARIGAGGMAQKADGAEGAWSNAFLNAVGHACETAMVRLFGGVNDEKIKQALAQGFSAGVDWCCSEQFDADVAKAALAIGLAPEEAATGAVRKTG